MNGAKGLDDMEGRPPREARFMKLAVWLLVTGVVAVAGLLAILMACAGFIAPLDAAVQLLFGWLLFIGRSAGEITIRWDGVATAVVCLFLFTFGANSFFKWYFAHTGQSTAAARRQWQFRWTRTLVATLVLMFVSGIAAVGLTHQVAWIVTSPEPPLLVRGSIRDAASRTQSLYNLKQIGIATHFCNDAKGAMPAGVITDAHGRMLHGWQTGLLPYIEQEALYQQIRLDLPWSHAANAKPLQTAIRTFLQPQVRDHANADGYALSHYAGNVRVLGGDMARRIPADFPDGLSTTLLAGEAAGNFKPWGHPANWRDPALGLNKTPDGFGSAGRQTVQFVMADASVRSISDTVSPTVLKALSTPDGGEKIPDDY
jgi:hypothetical protein